MSSIHRSTGLAALATAGLIAMASAASAQTAPCPTNALGITSPTACSCASGGGTGAVWGTNVYTADSNVCVAAAHAGVIGAGGGQILVTPGSGYQSYPGSTQNGITTSTWGSYDRSFTVSLVSMQTPACATMPAGADVYECSCPAGPYAGSAWGSGPYTNDSSICVAALHSGVLTAAGGTVRVLSAPGLQSYRGSEWNGASTMDYGPWSGSILFDRN
ncbi:LCCL domain-containing protein [Nioella ostreopsis]|uniref:LCCL domain-containing protein n=1 Tax=Nioella ostreopsis TaxID=2448479 RepID=UPI000FDB870E|nr:LCCL domain-containing protein [Nioella ostreopsis]